jgi:hypothetical protein
VVCEFTKDFGFKQATVTVVSTGRFTPRCNAVGFIRSDVVLQPGMVDLGTVDHGSLAQKKVAVSYSGREDWKILDVKSANEHLEVEVHETGRGRGKVTYDLLVRLKDDAPVGYLQDQLFLVTNDPKASDLPVDVEGSVVSEITVSPASLFLGVVQPGQKVTKQLVVRGRKPFKITGVDCTDDCFQIKTPDDAKKVHLVPVVYIAGEQPGKVTRKITSPRTRENAQTEVVAYAGGRRGPCRQVRPAAIHRPPRPARRAIAIASNANRSNYYLGLENGSALLAQSLGRAQGSMVTSRPGQLFHRTAGQPPPPRALARIASHATRPTHRRRRDQHQKAFCQSSMGERGKWQLRKDN